jgi:hypothetical protein
MSLSEFKWTPKISELDDLSREGTQLNSSGTFFRIKKIILNSPKDSRGGARAGHPG